MPVERIWLDVSEAEGAGSATLGAAETAKLAEQIAALVAAMPDDEPASERLERLLRHLPEASPALRRSVLQLMEAPHE